MSPTEQAMHLVSTNREALLAELDRHGEEEVRLALAKKTYNQEKATLAQDWLRHKEQQRTRMSEIREEAFRLEQARAAERAAAAAERQAVTAERANKIALAALIFVGASFVLSLGALFKRHR